MNYLLLMEVLEGLEHLNCESANEGEGNSLEVIVFYEFIEVYGEKFKAYDQVLAEIDVVLDADDVVLVVGIVSFQVLQYL